MANFTIFQYYIHTNRGSGYDAGNIVQVQWNDVSEAIEVWKSVDIFDVSPVLKTSGPSLGIEGVDHTLVQTGYKFCDGTTLVYFTYNSSIFPYGQKQEQLNSIACVIYPVCDLVFTNKTSTPATNTSSNDGTITVVASSSNGPIKYALYDFNYSLGEGQSSGSFTSLYGGSYTVYAKDNLGCVISDTIIVDVVSTYSIRFFAEWQNRLVLNDHKIEIYERGYDGDPEEIKAAGFAATLKLNSSGDDRFSVIRPTELVFRAIDQENFKYVDLFAEDERQFLIKYFRDDGNGYVLRWLGYLQPFLYSEPYIPQPYTVEITATDGLGNLKDFDFVDKSGNKFSQGTYLTFICEALKKLDLDITLISGVNLFEDSMTQTSTDDPLEQASIATNIYYNNEGVAKKFDEVLKNILSELGAAISQADGKWIVFRPEETQGNFPYREFDLDGNYVTDDVIDPLIYLKDRLESNRIVWKDKSGSLTILPSYGNFSVNQHLDKKPSLLPSYSFEANDLVTFGPDDVFFAGWNISINTANIAKWGFKAVDRGDSQGCLAIDFSYFAPFASLGEIRFSDPVYDEVVLYTTFAETDFESKDYIRLSFDFLVDSLDDINKWHPFKIKLKIGDYFLYQNVNTDGSYGFTSSDNGYIPFTTDTFNKWDNFEMTVKAPRSTLDTGVIDFSMIISNGGADLDETELRALPTTGVGSFATYKKQIAYINIDTTRVKAFYELVTVESTATENFPDLILPDDFNSITNPIAWQLQGYNNGLVNAMAVLIDNVVFEYLPNGITAPEEQASSVTTNPNNKRNLEIDMYHGDVPTNITNASHIYDSHIYVGVTPTNLWTRLGIAESEPLRNILLKSYITQFQKPSRQLNGTFVTDLYLLPYNCVVETMDDDRKYQVQGYEIDLTDNTTTAELLELKDSGAINNFDDAFDKQAFGTSFN